LNSINGASPQTPQGTRPLTLIRSPRGQRNRQEPIPYILAFGIVAFVKKNLPFFNASQKRVFFLTNL